MGDRYRDAHAERPTFLPGSDPHVSPSQGALGGEPMTGTPDPGTAPHIGTPVPGIDDVLRLQPQAAMGTSAMMHSAEIWSAAYYDESGRIAARELLNKAAPILETATHFLFVDAEDAFHCLPVATTGVATGEDGMYIVSRMGGKVVGVQVKKGTKIRAVGPREVAEVFNRAG